MIWFVLGPSGVGKSSFGDFLANVKGWHHLEIDQFGNDGIDSHGLRQHWDAYYNNFNPSGLIKELEEQTKDSGKPNCVLTFPGNLVLLRDHVSVVEDDIRIIYLYGSASRCIFAFLKREQGIHRNLGLDHWMAHNRVSYMRMSIPELETNRVYVWTYNGERRSHEDVFDEVLGWD